MLVEPKEAPAFVRPDTPACLVEGTLLRCDGSATCPFVTIRPCLPRCDEGPLARDRYVAQGADAQNDSCQQQGYGAELDNQPHRIMLLAHD